MKKNIGSFDKYLRIIIGLALLSLTILVPTYWGLIGIVPLLTAFMGNCPLYSVIGVSTCKNNPEKK